MLFIEQALNGAGEAVQGLELMGPRQTWPLAASRVAQWSGQFASGPDAGQTWLLMGDSAHRIHPLAGQGLNLGLGDVRCWQRIWAERQGAAYWRAVDDAKLVRRYARERQAKADLALGVTDGLFQIVRERTELPGPLGVAWPKFRQAGLALFNRSGPFKHWVASQAMR